MAQERCKALARFLAQRARPVRRRADRRRRALALGVPVDFMLFGLTLAGVALFHHHTLQVALTGLA